MMNRIAYLAAGAATSERNRNRIAKTGRTPSGDAIWTEEEEAILRLHCRDYQAALRALGGRRTYYAIRNHAQKMGVATKRTHWTAEQVSRLRRVYRAGTANEVREAFPERSARNIHAMAQYFGIKRPRKPFAPTGILVIDQIRERCFECALSMVDLDDMAGTGDYFARGGWHSGRVKASAVAKAVKALGGELSVRWDGDQERAAASASPRAESGSRTLVTPTKILLAA